MPAAINFGTAAASKCWHQAAQCSDHLGPTLLERLVAVNSKAWPMAGMLGFDRLGYLQLDLYPKRLFLPTPSGIDRFEVTPNYGRLDVKVTNRVVSGLCYWNAGWRTARAKELSGNCGSALISHVKATARAIALRIGRSRRSTFGRYVLFTGPAALMRSAKH